ncbi:MAG: hypothetical protein HQM09_24140 [Candidatus Riflebacteria bacterium]|nr:hypothetical protein [Candidatus Riflebacteria bacterium]
MAIFVSLFIVGRATAWTPLLHRTPETSIDIFNNGGPFIDGKRGLGSEARRLLLDPDDWSNAEIMRFTKAGYEVAAWFNIAARESGRTLSEQIDQKWLVLPKKGAMPEPAPGRFYLEAWQRVHLARLDEIAHKGFSSVVLGGIDTALRITNHPAIELEMITWIKRVASHFKGLGFSTRRVYIYLPDNYPLSRKLPALVDGVLAEGLWYGPHHLGRHPWEREAFIKAAADWKTTVMTLDDVPGEEAADRVRAESHMLGFDAGFGMVPLPSQIHLDHIDALQRPHDSSRSSH